MGKQGIELVIFDLDGTLTESKASMGGKMSDLISALLPKKEIAVISGCSYSQFKNQFLKSLHCKKELLKRLYLFPTCAASFYRYSRNEWKNVYSESLSGREKAKIKGAFAKAFRDVGFTPKELHGKMIEDRGGQITFSALGQEASLELKQKWDPERKKRLKIKKALEDYISEFEIRIGGTTSIDITRKGIDKAYGISRMEKYLNIKKENMLFIGDALFKGGNDYPVKQTGVEYIEVSGPEETKKVIKSLIGGQ